eukprot:COSAG05_NODE_249_length_12903_cov_128.635505_5_plen_49_part_00
MVQAARSYVLDIFVFRFRDSVLLLQSNTGGGEVDYDEFEKWWRAQGGS